MRSVSRITGVSINTVSKLLIDAGLACAAFHDKTVRRITAKAVQCDEIWSFSYAEQKNVKFAKSRRPSASIPSRDEVSLAGGTRSRVPPRGGAMLTLLRVPF